MILQFGEQIFGGSKCSDHTDSLYVKLLVMTHPTSSEAYFNPCRRLASLFFDSFYNALYGRFKKSRNVNAICNEMLL